MSLLQEQVMGLAKAARRVPPVREGKPTHSSTLTRWIMDGCKAVDGTVVKLEALRLGNRWVTSLEALDRFAERLTHGAAAGCDKPKVATKSKRADKVEKELDKILGPAAA